MIEYVLAAIGSVLVPSVGWVVSKTIDTSARLDVHEAADAVTFKAISEHLSDLKDGQQSQSEKLDRLIEAMLSEARKSRRKS